MAIQSNEKKLAELILYVSQKYANDPHFGSVKLHKSIFFPDFTAYASWGESITGAQYHNQKQGPMVFRMLPVQRELKISGDLAVQRVDCFGYPQDRTVNLREPDLALFNGREIALVDAWIERLRPMTAREVSSFSHQTAGWQLTSEGDMIPLNTAFIGWIPPDAAEIKRGRELATKFGLLA